MTNSLATTFQARSMPTVLFRKTKVTMQVIPEAHIRRIVSLDLITMVLMIPNLEETMAVSTLIRVKDSIKANGNNILTSSPIEENPTTLISRQEQTSPEGTHSTNMEVRQEM